MKRIAVDEGVERLEGGKRNSPSYFSYEIQQLNEGLNDRVNREYPMRKSKTQNLTLEEMQDKYYFTRRNFSEKLQNRIHNLLQAKRQIPLEMRNEQGLEDKSVLRREQSQEQEAMSKRKWCLSEISFVVKQIISNRLQMTYKEISDAVLNGLDADLAKNPFEWEKQAKNIRRRVYDALNVLVAVNILGKASKDMLFTNHRANIIGRKLAAQWDTYSDKKKASDELAAKCKVKKIHLETILEEIKMLKCLHQTNAVRQSKAEVKGESKYKFPLLFIKPSKEKFCPITMSIENKQEQNMFKASGKQIMLFCQSNALKYLQIDNLVQKQKLNEKINKLYNQSTVDPITRQLTPQL